MILKLGKVLHKGEKGFTLIELIVVVAVLSVLATLVVPRVIGVKDKAEKAVDDANKKIIINALERYYAEEGKYPAKLENLKGDYLNEIPKKVDETDWSYEIVDGKPDVK